MALLPLRLLFKNRQHFGRLYFLSDRNCKTFWGHSVIFCYDAQRILAKILNDGYTISSRPDFIYIDTSKATATLESDCVAF